MKKEYILYGGILVLLYFVLYKFGILGKKKALNDLDGFNYKKYKANVSKYGFGAYKNLIADDIAQVYAKQIYDSKGIFKDDDSVVINIFKSVSTTGDVSKISIAFSTMYNQDMASYLNFLDKASYINVYEYVSNMPSGFKKPSAQEISASKSITGSVGKIFPMIK